MVNAQIWLDKEYPKERRKNVKKIDIGQKQLEGSLRLEGFTNLEKLTCRKNDLEDLDLKDCQNLTEIDCCVNRLKSTRFLKELPNPEKLVLLNLGDNNFSPEDLKFFEPFVNLKYLRLWTCEVERIEQGLYNRFYGSLSPLKNMYDLEEFTFANTDIDSGLEHLANTKIEKISNFFAGGTRVVAKRGGAKSDILMEQLRPFDFKLKDWQSVSDTYPNLIRQQIKIVKENYYFRSGMPINEWEKRIKELEETVEVERKERKSEKAELEGEIKELRERFRNSIITDKPINLGSELLYSGDVITIKVKNGPYLKRTEEGYHVKTVQTSSSNSPNDHSHYFMAEVVEGNKVHLRVPNSNLYCQLHDSQSFFPFPSKKQTITFTENPDEANIFLVNNENNNEKSSEVLLKATDNKYLKVDNNRSLSFQDKEIDSSTLLVNKVNIENITHYREVIEDIQFHMENKKSEKFISSTPQELVQVNHGDEPQTYNLTYSREYGREVTYDWGVKLSANVQAGVKIGAPIIAEGELAISLSGEISGGNSYTFSKKSTISGSLQGTCPGNSKMVSTTTLQEYYLEVPITTTISRYLTDSFGNKRKYTYKVDGMFKGNCAKIFVDHGKSVPLAEKEMTQVEYPPKGTQN